MAAQIVLPFRFRKSNKVVKAKSGNDDLVGLSYYDGTSDVVVTGTSPSNPKLVFVERMSDGKTWTVPVGLMRLITVEKKKRKTA